jgi:hypothetical protein
VDRIKTSLTFRIPELFGETLDRAVAKALGYTDYPDDSLEHGTIWHTEPDKTPFGRFIEKRHFNPSSNWAVGGPIIEREGINLRTLVGWTGSMAYQAEINDNGNIFYGHTPLVAAMRCFVASRLGSDISIEEG